MEPITVVDALSPVISRNEAATTASVINSAAHELDQLVSLGAPGESHLGTKIDTKA